LGVRVPPDLFERNSPENPDMFTKSKSFFSEVRAELQKASWPWESKDKGIRRYKELTDSTLVVIIAMLLLGGYVALFDFILISFIHYFTRIH
jgi:preprotein translocase subunit SecE